MAEVSQLDVPTDELSQPLVRRFQKIQKIRDVLRGRVPDVSMSYPTTTAEGKRRYPFTKGPMDMPLDSYTSIRAIPSSGRFLRRKWAAVSTIVTSSVGRTMPSIR